jgi:hypothetical protein
MQRKRYKEDQDLGCESTNRNHWKQKRNLPTGNISKCRNERVWRKEGTARFILNLGNSFMPSLLYSQGQSTRYLLNKKLGGPYSHSVLSEEQKNILSWWD